MIPKKEKRDEVLYVNIKPTLKVWLKKEYRKLGFSTLSEYIDAVLTEVKVKSK